MIGACSMHNVAKTCIKFGKPEMKKPLDPNVDGRMVLKNVS